MLSFDGRTRGVSLRKRAESALITAVVMSPFAICALAGFVGFVYFDLVIAKVAPALLIFAGGCVFGLILSAFVRLFESAVTFFVVNVKYLRDKTKGN